MVPINSIPCWSPPYQHQNTTYDGLGGITSMHYAGHASDHAMLAYAMFISRESSG